jgi:hypothetical protein
MKLLTHELLEKGYNVLPVGADKQPLTQRYGECYDRHCPELRKYFESHLVKRRQVGIALLGRVNPRYPEKILVIIDVDDPRRFPEEARQLLKDTWHWLTGPRCPVDGDKHNISCQGPLPTALCRHNGHEFRLEEATRGEAYAVLVPAEAEGLVAGGVAKLMGGAVELRIRGYQLIPPSLHPSGVVYEWVVTPWAGGGFSHPKELSLEEFRKLLGLLGGAAPRQEAPQGAAAEGCKRLRELADRDIDAVLEVVKPYYLPGFRNAILYALLGVLKRRCYSETSIRRLYDRLQEWAMSVYSDIDKKKDDYILEGVLRGRDWRLFGWNKLREVFVQAAPQVGKTEGDAERDVARLRQILAPAVRMRYCLEYEREEGGVACVKYLRAKEVAEGLLVEVVVKKTKSAKVVKVALLPRRMAIVRDPYYAEEYYVAYSGGRLLTAAPADDWDGFLTAIRQRPPYYVIGRTGVVDAIKRILPRLEAVISAGLTDDGVADPLGVLDAADYGVEPLVAAYRWIKAAYSERNAKLAWFNVVAVFAKLFTPLVRAVKRNFVDYVIYNVGRGGEGKSTLARYILTPLLGGAAALETYNIRVDGAVRTEAQLRNLLALNRLPLILDEQTRRALVNNSAILLSAAVGLGTTGIHAAKHGLGVATKFKNLRGVLVFTNVAFTTFIKEAAVDSSDYALLRRFIELAWDFEPISTEAFRQIPELKPVLGYAAGLWRRHRESFLESADLLELIERAADAIAEGHPGDQEIAEIAEFTKQIISEVREEKKTERMLLRDEDAVVERAYRYVAEELKATQLNAVKVIRHLLENPHRVGIAFSRPRHGEQVKERADDVADVIMRIKNMYATAPAGDKLAEDATVVVNMLNSLINEGRVNVVIFAKSPLVPGAPRQVMDAPRSVYAVNGARRHGYSIPLAKFLRIFLDSEPVEEDA